MCRRLSPRTIPVVAIGIACLLLPTAISAQVIKVQPYVQPGDGPRLSGADVKVIQWLTDQTPGFFVVEYFQQGGPTRTARPVRIALDFPIPAAEPRKAKEPAVKPAEPARDADDDPNTTKDDAKEKDKVPPLAEKNQHFYRYTAQLDKLPFNSEITYRVKLGNNIVRQASFRTRATGEKSVRCVMVGDLAQGRNAQKEIAYRISLEKPEFLVALGDIVYSAGRVSQYMAYFWDTYNNVAQTGLKSGAPLMAGIPFYPVLGNHDVSAKLSRKMPDALGVYLFFNPPKNGPGVGPWNTLVDAKEPGYKDFRAATVDSYPYIDTYSFDNGPAHFVVINTNRPLDSPIFRKWLIDDLKTTGAKWKIVCFHIPGFHSSRAHYAEQQLRQLQPIFEEHGVDLTFGGHVHNYQRTVPLRFVPKSADKGRVLGGKKYQINGDFTLDSKFDGIKHTQADGVIHIVAGGGGASLYGPGLEKTAAALKKDYGPDNYVDFTARMVVDQHSFVVLDIAPGRLELRALGARGNELDRITLTRSEAKK